MRKHVRTVIVGGGCVGAGVAYGLAKRGWGDCALIERSRLTGGSTWMAGGVIPSYARSPSISRLINESLAIYRGLEADTGQAVGWDNCGQMRIARLEGRMDEYRSYMDTAEAIGANAALLSAEECLELWPLLKDTNGLLGALYHPDDGRVSPTDVTMALVKGARDHGARVYENTTVQGFHRARDGDWVVETDQGELACEHLVLATGNYSRDTGRLLGLDIPAISLVVQFWITEPIAAIAARRQDGLPQIPIVRDEAFLGYTCIEGDGLLFGSYERPEHLELFGLDRVPEGYDGELFPAHFEAHAEAFERAGELIPVLNEVGIKSNTRGPMQMTADGLPLVGPAWGLDNVWLAEGVPGGILWGGAIGSILSEWIIDGGACVDVHELDSRRFGCFANKAWTKARAVELWGTHSDVRYPAGESGAARLARVTPAYGRLDALGAAWGVRNGWETPLWYASKGEPKTIDASYRGSRHEHFVEQEVHALRRTVGLADVSALSKFEVSGPGASRFLDGLLASRLPGAGRIRLGYQLFQNGGVRAHYSVARIEDGLFYLVCMPESERLNFDELRRLLPTDGSVHLRNVTAERGAFLIAGPKAREVLQGFVDADIRNDAFPRLTVCRTAIGLANDVLLMRISRTGELAWEIHHAMESQHYLLESLLEAGRAQGMRLVGQLALDVARLEKSYAEIPCDMNSQASALECGLLPLIDFDKAEFVGRSALLRERDNGIKRRLCTLAVEAEHASPHGHEGVYYNGELVGRVTSAATSAWLGQRIALALLSIGLTVPGTRLTVPVLGESCAATVLNDSPYDPTNERSRI